MLKADKPVGLISFFSGAGTLDLGFEDAGFKVFMANEMSPSFAEGYRFARASMGSPMPVRGIYNCSAEKYLERGWQTAALSAAMGEAREECGLVGFIGGPPCPDFSIAGKMAGPQGDNGRLTKVYIDLILWNLPDFFVMENVPGLWRSGENMEFYAGIEDQLREVGYRITSRVVNSIEYGVPQDRRRVIVLGFYEPRFSRDAAVGAAELSRRFPWHQGRLNYDPLALRWPTTDVFREASTMPIPDYVRERLTVQHWFKKNRVEKHPNGQCHFQPNAMARFLSVPEGDTHRKSFKRLHRWRYSPTAAYGNNEVHLHPYLPRRISVAEAMAIQSFPRKFALPPEREAMTLSDKFKTVANAVPYMMAKSIASTLISELQTSGIR